MAQESVDLLVIENVSKSFDGRCVLKDVSAKLSTGKILGLIGKSAAGKSVLIHMLRGSEEYAPDSGRVIYNVNRCKKCGDLDLPIKGAKCCKCGGETETLAVDFWSLKVDDPLRQAVKGHIAIMLQRTFALFGDMTVVENVMEAIPADVQGDDRINRAIDMLKLVNMTHRTTHIARDLSGGEKQRVVMARQLAKEPLFFLADEPTGALDSETSIQVMELLKEVAKDRLVVMVTHNPELAERYATRIVKLKDGVIRSDTMPYEPEDEAAAVAPVHRNMGHSSMSLLTSLSLSFNNLLTKKARTLLTAFAGSIGIIGIALILSLSNGVSRYISNMEKSTLAAYPLQISSTGVDLASMMDPDTYTSVSSGSSSAPEGMVTVLDQEQCDAIKAAPADPADVCCMIHLKGFASLTGGLQAADQAQNAENGADGRGAVLHCHCGSADQRRQHLGAVGGDGADVSGRVECTEHCSVRPEAAQLKVRIILKINRNYS